jgi:ERCC4-type nuclease
MSETVKIVVDTREKLPYEFSDPSIQAILRALPAGDYSIVGLESKVAVERKTLDDFVRSIIRERKRFYKELRILSGYRAACIVVEGNLRDVKAHKYKGELHPNSVFSIAVSIFTDFGIPVFFCSSRSLARKFTELFLTRMNRILLWHKEK